MNILVDTHCFIWSLLSPARLSDKAMNLLKHETVYVSAVTFWEISIKHALGKLTLSGISPAALSDAAQSANYKLLSLAATEAGSFHKLPVHKHKDPFDRMLVWQAITRSMMLLTKDATLAQYQPQGLNITW